MKKIIYILLSLVFVNCSSVKVCNKIVDDSVVVTFNAEKDLLELGGESDGRLFGNVNIQSCFLKKDVLNLKFEVVDVYGKVKNSKIDIYLFENNQNTYLKKVKLEFDNSSKKIRIENVRGKENYLIVFRFDNDWDKLICKRLN